MIALITTLKMIGKLALPHCTPLPTSKGSP
jgi:hypothetical protein